MIVFFKKMELDNIAIIDAEYNEGELIQFAGIMFRRIGDGLYQISHSINIYVKLPNGRQINNFIRKFTGITNYFLQKEGVELSVAANDIEEFLSVSGSLGIVAHDIQNDNDFLCDNGINIEDFADEMICSYKLSQQVYKDTNQKLNLKALSFEAGFQHDNTHNALDDVWATMAVFSLLKKLEHEELKKNEILKS